MIKKLLWITLAVVAAMTTRAALKAWAPGLYGRVWGEREVLREVTNDRPEDGQLHEEPRKPETEPPKQQDQTPPPLYATGAIRYKKRVLVQMSDGTVRTDLDNSDTRLVLTAVTSTYADIEGRRYWFRPREQAKTP